MTQTILITGANGGVASMIRPALRARYGGLVLSDRDPVTDLADGEDFRGAELTDFEAVRAACKGVDAIIHLGGQPHEAPWDVIDASNLTGMTNLMEAARAEKVERVVFASSNHAVGMYARNRKVGTEERVRPDSRYGVSKAYGEALCALFADKYGMRCLSVRIGNVALAPADNRRLSIWLHPEDFVQLCIIGIEHPDLHNEVVYGASDNIRSFWDNGAAFRLGYRPKHRAEDHRAEAEAGQAEIDAKGPRDTVAETLQGGGFAADEFSGDLDRTAWD
ncbi:NAD-dependent epimerase/dehydratase family protein [Oceanomicrobium pacificus]|uniref:NAD-dependent epimerase/dehydratase family protein n=1 Tax=Oceanomicrobium pacificus TaxID=2692916 RepID=A0A6B0U2B7_9RHOB|nr:NAD(P)-dependent oxidoreductase [Oceanomicrobium pacificus]MXU65171.1 NAD-dependent epimerase/dehydratase family protein [Oceanomicrobium pacificus]